MGDYDECVIASKKVLSSHGILIEFMISINAVRSLYKRCRISCLFLLFRISSITGNVSRPDDSFIDLTGILILNTITLTPSK